MTTPTIDLEKILSKLAPAIFKKIEEYVTKRLELKRGDSFTPSEKLTKLVKTKDNLPESVAKKEVIKLDKEIKELKAKEIAKDIEQKNSIAFLNKKIIEFEKGTKKAQTTNKPSLIDKQLGSDDFRKDRAFVKAPVVSELLSSSIKNIQNKEIAVATKRFGKGTAKTRLEAYKIKRKGFKRTKQLNELTNTVRKDAQIKSKEFKKAIAIAEGSKVLLQNKVKDLKSNTVTLTVELTSVNNAIKSEDDKTKAKRKKEAIAKRKVEAIAKRKKGVFKDPSTTEGAKKTITKELKTPGYIDKQIQSVEDALKVDLNTNNSSLESATKQLQDAVKENKPSEIKKKQTVIDGLKDTRQSLYTEARIKSEGLKDAQEKSAFINSGKELKQRQQVVDNKFNRLVADPNKSSEDKKILKIVQSGVKDGGKDSVDAKEKLNKLKVAGTDEAKTKIDKAISSLDENVQYIQKGTTPSKETKELKQRQQVVDNKFNRLVADPNKSSEDKKILKIVQSGVKDGGKDIEKAKEKLNKLKVAGTDEAKTKIDKAISSLDENVQYIQKGTTSSKETKETKTRDKDNKFKGDNKTTAPINDQQTIKKELKKTQVELKKVEAASKGIIKSINKDIATLKNNKKVFDKVAKNTTVKNVSRVLQRLTRLSKVNNKTVSDSFGGQTVFKVQSEVTSKTLEASDDIAGRLKVLEEFKEQVEGML